MLDTQEHSVLVAKLTTHADIDAKLSNTQAEHAQITKDAEALQVTISRLIDEKSMHDATLMELPQKISTANASLAEVETKLADTSTKHQQALAAEHESIASRVAAEQAATLLKTESANLEKLISEKRSSLDGELKAKLDEAQAVECKLAKVHTKVADAEKRLAELKDVDTRLADAGKALKEAEKQRLAEEKALAELAKRQEKLREEAAIVKDEMAVKKSQADEFAKRARADELRVSNAEAALERAVSAQQNAESKREQAELAVQELWASGMQLNPGPQNKLKKRPRKIHIPTSGRFFRQIKQAQ